MYPQINHLKSLGLGFPTYKMDTIIPALLPSLVILRTKQIYMFENNNKMKLTRSLEDMNIHSRAPLSQFYRCPRHSPSVS